MGEKEIVIQLGVEGGGATIVRSLNAAGDWQFQLRGSSFSLDENDDEQWTSWEGKPLQTFEEALRSVSHSWPLFYPLMVHPEYRTDVLKLVQAEADALPVESGELWKMRQRDWEACCSE